MIGAAVRGRRRALSVVTLAFFVDMTLYGALVPLSPSYAIQHGLSESALGVVFGAYGAAIVLVTPLAGRVVDRAGPKRALEYGMGGIACATLAFLVAGGFGALLASRFAQGVAAAIVWSAGYALLARAFDVRDLGRAMGTATLGTSAGMLLGPPLSGRLSAGGDRRIPFLCIALLAVAVAIASAVSMRGDAGEAPRSRPPSSRTLARDPSVRRWLGVSFMGAAALGMLEPTLPMHLERRLSASMAAVGGLFAAAVLGWGASAPLAGRLSDRWGRSRVSAAGWVALCVTLPLVGLPSSWAWQAVVMVSLGFGLGTMSTPVLASLAELDVVRSEQRYGEVYALYNMAYALGAMVGPVAGGLLVEQLSFRSATIVASLGVLAGGALLHVRRSR